MGAMLSLMMPPFLLPSMWKGRGWKCSQEGMVFCCLKHAIVEPSRSRAAIRNRKHPYRRNDLTAARDFDLLAQETDSLLEGPDQITAIIENNRYNDPDHIKQQYHCLAVLLHPDKNKFSSAGTAFKLVNDAWEILSDPLKKSTYDKRLFEVFTNLDHENEKMHVKRNNVHGNIWTLCPYCYNLYEYPKVYEGCCLRCVNCERAFQVVVILAESLPEIVPGKEAYYFRQGHVFILDLYIHIQCRRGIFLLILGGFPWYYTHAYIEDDVTFIAISSLMFLAKRSMFEISENNFNDWFCQLKMVLRVERKLFVIEQPISLASLTDSEYLSSGMRYMIHNKELKSMFEKQARVEWFDLIQTFHACKQDEGNPVGPYHNMGKIVGELHVMLIEYEKGLPKKAETPQVMMIKGGKIQKSNKKLLKAKGKGKANGKGKDKQVYIPKPSAKEHPVKDDTCHHCKEVGHCKRNCPAYLAELIKKKKQVGTASSSDVFIIELFPFPTKS
ncbi:DnaJ domain-containing protein [Tanacetum coccineum]